MNGGKVRLAIPSGWKIGINNITSITDGGISLFLTSARLTDDSIALIDAGTGIRGPAPKSARDLRRISWGGKEAELTSIDVELDAFDWGVDRAADRKLIIVLGTEAAGITLPIPTSLPSTLNRQSGVNFKAYPFTTSSTVTGSFGSNSRLKPNDDDDNPTHPVIRIGNIANAGAGTPTITPSTTYVGEEGDFTIRFTAKGPIYDVDIHGDGVEGDNLRPGDIDARIVVNLDGSAAILKMLPDPLPKTLADGTTKLVPPPAITTAQVSALDTFASDGVARTSGNSRKAGYVTVKGSGVSFAPKRIVLNDTTDNDGVSTDNIVTINIRNMNKDGYVDLTYKKMWALGTDGGGCGGLCRRVGSQ